MTITFVIVCTIKIWRKKMKIQKLAVVFIMSVSFILIACGKKDEASGSAPSAKPTPLIVPVKSLKEKKKEELEAHASTSESVIVDTSSIKGRKLGGLYSDITGIHGLVGTRYEIDFGELLANMWLRKLDRKNVSEATIKSSSIPIQVYLAEPKKMNLRQFVNEAEKQVSVVKKNLDFAAACKNYKLNTAECGMFKALSNDIRGLDLIAYGMTEIMPTAEGDLNVKVLEILLRNAGSNYMFTIPALYDRMLSLGYYQFTSYAVNSGTGQGASRMNKFLPKEVKIPGSVIALRNGEHHRAAYLFALDNLANLARRTTVKEFEALEKALKQNPGDIVTFMATSHHAPGLALKCMKSWLTKGAKGTLNEHLRGRLRPYGKKSDNNLAALERSL